MLRLAIAGGGIGGSALVSLLRSDPNTEIVGVYEPKLDAPGVILARKWNIPVFAEIEALPAVKPEIVINVTGNHEVSKRVREVFRDHIEVIEGIGARFLWEIIEKQKRAKIEVIKTIADQKILYSLAARMCSLDTLQEFCDLILTKALEMADAPAGSIAVYENRQMRLVSSKGLSKRFLENRVWSVLPGGLTERVFLTKEFAEITDALKVDYTNNPALISEKIRAVLACPVLLRGEVAGILYIDDFKPRQLSDRQKTSLNVVTGIVAAAIERFSLLKGVEEYRAKFSCLIESSNDAVIITDSFGIIMSGNEQAASLLGYGRDDLIGKSWTSILKSEEMAESLARALESRPALRGFGLALRDARGRDLDAVVNASLLQDRAGGNAGTVYTLRSMKDEFNLKGALQAKTKELEELNANLEKKILLRTEELEQANKELEKANQLKGRFIANISHELRTPLNSVLGFSEVLLEKTVGTLNDSQERFVRNIYSAGKHLLELINNVLDIAKIEAGKYEMVYETFRVGDLLDEVVSIMRQFAAGKFIEIGVEKDEHLDLMTADRVKIKQILYNLLSNAIKFTPEGRKVGVTAGYADSGESLDMIMAPRRDFVKFSVWDTGVGIGPEDKERIFEEFEQIDSAFSREYGGVGLGLALTKRLVELHGGAVSVESSLGEGSTFTFSIPVTAAVEEQEPEEQEAVGLTYPWMSEEAPLILAVEDDTATAEILTLHLSQAGYKVAHAFNGEEAISKARELRPFAITLDVMLPKKDGWEVLQDLKSDPRTSDIPVIIHSIVDNKELAFALGATDYLLKPLDKVALLQKLEEINITKGRLTLPASILVIEGDEQVTAAFREILEPQGYLIYSAAEGRRGVELAAALRPGLVLLDFALPDMLGFDVIQQLKDGPSTRDIPIFILSERDLSVEDRISLVGKIERIIKKNAFDTKEFIDHIKELEILYPKRAGLIDELTGIFSHRYFQIRLAQEVERAARYKLPLNLVLLDVDFFGQFVKDHGEYHGNNVLRKVSELLRKNIRGSDVVVRYGGDAFAIILPNTVIAAGISLSNRFNAIIKNYPFLHEETQPKGRLTASVGIVHLDSETSEEFILCAEKALALAIRKGGDRVEVFSREQDEREKVG